ncbi:MAG TPA: ATP-binding protein [Dehalococcoidia bacterium]|nr:ATP-binding protein [Dehalococcoidia bacterium]
MKIIGRLSLGAKIGLSIAFVLIAGIAVVGFFSVQAIKQSTATALDERQNMARLIADYEDQMLQRALSEMQSASTVLSSPSQMGDVVVVTSRLEHSLLLLGMAPEDIFVMDSAGKVVWSKYSGLSLKTSDMLSYKSVKQAVTLGKSTVSGAILEPGMARQVVLLSVPFQPSGAGNGGALVAAIDVGESGLGGFARSVKLGETGYVEVVDQDGVVLVRTQPGRPLSPLEMSDHPERFAQLIAAKQPVTGTCHTCHQSGVRSGQDVLAFVPLNQSPWGVVVRQSESEALAPVRRLRDRFAASGAILLAVALGMTWVTTRDMVVRIRQLRDASRRMAEGDLAMPIAVSGGDEIAALSGTFDNMRVRLNESYAEIGRKTRAVEEAKARSEADRLKSQFISAMSHELRTPLTSIKGYSTSLLRDDVEWDKTTTREFLSAIDQKADELTALIDKLLQMSKIEGGAIKLDKEPVVLSRLVERVLKDNGFRSPKHQLSEELPADFPIFEADVRYLELVLHNLVENAIKYSPDGGHITVSGKFGAKEITFSVQDEGSGIPPEHLGKVFDRFYRVENSLTRRVAGTGLGLSITKGLVEAHGGRIWVESTTGKGSIFYVMLPRSGEEVGEETPGSELA